MEIHEIKLSDWERILVGEVPPAFYLEVVIRTIAIFLILMVAMRLNGRKIASQLGQSEMIATVALAAAIGIPLQSPDRGLLPAVLIAAVVILIQRGIARGITASEKFESLTQDSLSTLAKDGVCQLDAMKRSRITPERLRAQLRTKGVRHLGEVKRMYLEANGSFTFLKNDPPVAGLCILPGWDPGFRARVCRQTDDWVCCHCGMVRQEPGRPGGECPNCRWEVFEKAVI
ncbi:MAG: hypothetical protein ABS46_14110 [Cytophagaceae bacterium SCN 52-12]|nr:MAG: hypothetical protein ABS46_14110 [Cytophagaceae bacterium SCN 52-12]